ncbi:MAG: Rrf2 family transcriptional regulator [Lachnospiraceae bacterium]|nr:Rrf2 family transcriptional regulator [Lachnospiraceae bacterium]
MLLTRECDYGVRIIRALSNGEKKMVKTICMEEKVPDQYAYKILKKLEKAGFVQSMRGRDGGYQLIKSLDTFSLYDVVISIDENLFIAGCLYDDDFCSFRDGEHPCKVHKELDRVQQVLVKELKAKKITEIMEAS